MDIERVRTYAEFTNLEPVWNDLLTKAATNSVFLTHEWASSWWNAYAGKREFSILVLRDREAVRAIAPLMITDYSLFRRLGFIGSNRPDYCDFIVDRDHLAGYETLLTYLFYDFPDWDEIMLENVPETSPLLLALDKYSPRFIIKKHVVDVCPYLTLDAQTEKILRSIERKQSLKRKIKKLSEKGTLRFRHYSDRKEMEKTLGQLLEKYLHRFDHANLKKRLPLEIDFHLELLRRMGQKEIIQFAVLELDDQPIAQHLGFSYNGVYHWVKPAFNPLYAEHSPGALLLYYLIEHAWKSGYREFDFLRGKELFKTDITERFRQVMIFKLYRSFPMFIFCKAAPTLNSLLQRWAFRQR